MGHKIAPGRKPHPKIAVYRNLRSRIRTHPEESLFRVENGAMGGVNGTSDALCGSGSHEHIRADCYEL